MKIYYKYGLQDRILPDGGDTINENNNLIALSEIAEVYYNHRRFWGSTQRFGPLCKDRNYDVYIIRNNKKEFLQIHKNKKKYWIASPPYKDCFMSATKILTFSQAWADMLKKGVTCGLNPMGMHCENTFTIHQCIGDGFKPRQETEKTKYIREHLNSPTIIGHFGRVVKSNWPHLLCVAWKDILNEFGNVKMLTGITKTPFPIKSNPVFAQHIPYKVISYYISACDVIILGQHGEEWDYCGNLKTKEAAACGVPVICERSLAREEEFGKDYDLFMPKHSMELPITNEKIKLLIDRIKIAILKKEQFRSYLVERMKFYSIEKMRDRFKQLLEEK